MRSFDDLDAFDRHSANDKSYLGATNKNDGALSLCLSVLQKVVCLLLYCVSIQAIPRFRTNQFGRELYSNYDQSLRFNILDYETYWWVRKPRQDFSIKFLIFCSDLIWSSVRLLIVIWLGVSHNNYIAWPRGPGLYNYSFGECPRSVCLCETNVT